MYKGMCVCVGGGGGVGVALWIVSHYNFRNYPYPGVSSEAM